MACTCKNEDGTLAKNCIGKCVKKSIIKQEEDARRDPMNGFAELILSQVEQRIKSQMTVLTLSFKKEQFDVYKEAFLDGINEGIKIGRSLNKSDY